MKKILFVFSVIACISGLLLTGCLGPYASSASETAKYFYKGTVVKANDHAIMVHYDSLKIISAYPIKR